MDVRHFHEGKETSEELKKKKLVGVEPITTIIISGRLRWYGHVMMTEGKHVCRSELKQN